MISLEQHKINIFRDAIASKFAVLCWSSCDILIRIMMCSNQFSRRMTSSKTLIVLL
ncbi:hypothetical protein ACSBR1_016174 [Camellia fascicularis]